MGEHSWVLQRAAALGFLPKPEQIGAQEWLGNGPLVSIPEDQALRILEDALAEGMFARNTWEALKDEWLRRSDGLGGERPPASPTRRLDPDSKSLHLEGGLECATLSLDLDLEPGSEVTARYPVPGWPRYEPLAFLGRGAMGTVFKVFDPRLRRIVALKFIPFHRSEAGDGKREENLRQFLREAQTQAGVDHPHVAKVYEIGEVEDFAYLAIQFLEGAPLGEAGRNLPHRVAAELMEGLALGLHAVHRIGVIHRDIKPSNILVTRDEDQRPRGVLTDFGLAFSQEREDITLHGHLAGTPAYMSPEQARGGVLDTRSDVYSLGATFYEVLTGSLPVPPGGSITDLLDRIQQERPLPVRERNPQIPRDLEAIVMRCLEKAPGQRYDSALSLAQDLRQFLRGRPVQAIPPSLRYLAVRWATRNRALAALTLVLSITLVAGTSFLAWHLTMSNRALREEAETTREVSAFLTHIFEVNDPSQARGNTVTARELLDRGAEKIQTLKNRPKVQAAMMATMGRMYNLLGIYDQALPLLQQSLGNYVRISGPQSLDAGRNCCDLGLVYFRMGRLAESEQLLLRGLPILEATLGAGHPEVGKANNNLANVLLAQGRYPEAEQRYRKALAISKRATGPDSLDTVPALINIGNLYRTQSQFTKAEPFLRECLRIRQANLPADSPQIADCLNDLAVLDLNQQRLSEAEPLFQQSLAIRQKVLGPAHPQVADTLDNLANLYAAQNRRQEAKPLYLQALKLREAALGPDSPKVALSLNNLGSLYLDLKDYPQAEQVLTRSLHINEKALAADNPELALIHYNLACLDACRGKSVLALQELHKAFPAGKRTAWMLAISQDSQLGNLHGNPDFERIVAAVRSGKPTP